MSESDYDSANEYTSLMDGHVAESRTDDLILGSDRRKSRSRGANEEVDFFQWKSQSFISIEEYL